MSTAEVFAWGSFGGVVGYLLAYLVPCLRALADDDGLVKLGGSSKLRFIGLSGLAVTYAALGGAAAMTFGANTTTLAIVTGAGFEGVFKSATTKVVATSK